MPLEGEEFDNLNIEDCDIDFVKNINTADIYEFLSFANNKRKNNARTRARKLSAIKSFYKYLNRHGELDDYNPARDIDGPKAKKTLPKYLSLEESLLLLDAIKNDEESKFRERDYAIVTLFLNSGMRLSELVGINLSDIDRELRSLRVLGKGSKERIIYLNDASREALVRWLEVRRATEGIKEKNALFLSSRKQRISKKTVQWLVYKYLERAGLEYKHYSVHKLRHTAATLMYQTGKVDVRVLKDILGHEQLNTTQIYTHVSDASMERAMSMNPLSSVEGMRKTEITKKAEE